MTPKILSLEEIEKCAENLVWTSQYPNPRLDEFNALLATARAYWETKKKEVHINCRQCGMSTFVDIEDTNNNKLDDKPHARTIEAMIEALVKARNKSWDDVTGDYEFGAFVHHLESILKDLNN